jgi:hypothetical protein
MTEKRKTVPQSRKSLAKSYESKRPRLDDNPDDDLVDIAVPKESLAINEDNTVKPTICPVVKKDIAAPALADWLQTTYIGREKPAETTHGFYSLRANIDTVVNSLSMEEQNLNLIDSVFNIAIRIADITIKSNTAVSYYELFDVFEFFACKFSASVSMKDKDVNRMIEFYNKFFQLLDNTAIDPLTETITPSLGNTPAAQREKIVDASLKEAQKYWSMISDFLTNACLFEAKSELKLRLCQLRILVKFYKRLALEIWPFKRPLSTNKHWMRCLNNFDFNETVFNSLLSNFSSLVIGNVDLST